MQKFRDVLSRREAGKLSMMEAGELLGMSEQQLRRYRGPTTLLLAKSMVSCRPVLPNVSRRECGHIWPRRRPHDSTPLAQERVH